MTEFTPTHEFHLSDGTIVYVAAELLGDWIAHEQDGTVWYTVCGDLYPHWSCTSRGVYSVGRVIKYGHRFTVSESGTGRSYRYECECGEIGRWVRSKDASTRAGVDHHRDAVNV